VIAGVFLGELIEFMFQGGYLVEVYFSYFVFVVRFRSYIYFHLDCIITDR